MNMQYIWWVVGAPILVGTSCNHTSERAYLVCGGGPISVGTSCNHTFEDALFVVWWGPPFQWQPHAIIHLNMHYLVCGGGPYFSENLMQSYIRTSIYLVCGGGPHFSGNLIQSYIQTCTIRCVVVVHILVGTSCNHTFKHALFGMLWWPQF